MNTELQNRAWASLPDDFKIEIQEIYDKIAKALCKEQYELGMLHTYEGIFGVDNLTASGQPKPKFKVGDEVYQTYGQSRLDKYTVRKVYTDSNGHYIYDLQGLIGIFGVKECDLCFTSQNPYAKPEAKDETKPETKEETKEETMNGTKELDLCELLKGCEGMEFYSPCLGNCTFEGFPI